METTILKQKIDELKKLLDFLQQKKKVEEKITFLNDYPLVKQFFAHSGPIQKFVNKLSSESEYVMKAIIAIGQGPIVFNCKTLDEESSKKLLVLLEQLLDIEIFYDFLGGIIGYHYTVLTLLSHQASPPQVSFQNMQYLKPEGLKIQKDTLEVRQIIRQGLENLQHIGMIYPVGGAGDRLDLRDEKTNDPLPAALLPFLGRTLLDGMLRDVQAQEYLAFKLFGKQVTIPIAMMTSTEKNNHIHILNICKNSNWYGRKTENFFFFIQPLIPVITLDGNWSLSSPLTLTLKPSGHGVLWKLAKEAGVFQWLENQKRHQCLIRQINNPLAATDQGIFALIGYGCAHQKAFGFLSCERVVKSDEGTNILIEKRIEQQQPDGQFEAKYEYCLTNIEYTDFKKRGIEDLPANPESTFSIYPANTNILFANLQSIKTLLKECPIPGQLINIKSNVPFLDANGNLSYCPGGRLESTMQNIADQIVDQFPRRLNQIERQTALNSFILYNDRSKTISTTKRSYEKDKSPFSTPEQTFYDLMSNHAALLKQCQFELPEWTKIETVLEKGPPFIFLFHPGLGPLYSVITQKLRKGKIHPGGELQLEICEVNIEKLSLEGSLIIQSSSPLGTTNLSGSLQYGNESRCTLKNVLIQNLGIDFSTKNCFWKNEITRKEGVQINLGEEAEFHAENIILKGSHIFEVPPKHRLILTPLISGNWKEELIPIKAPTWKWDYTFDSKECIRLRLHT